MGPNGGSDDCTVSRRYGPDRELSLGDAVLETIEAYDGRDLSRSDVVLDDVVDPDALDDLVRRDGGADARFTFGFDDLQVSLQWDDAVHVTVADGADS